MTEERMKEYVVNGGKLFTITLIDTIRDTLTLTLTTMLIRMIKFKYITEPHITYTPCYV